MRSACNTEGNGSVTVVPLLLPYMLLLVYHDEMRCVMINLVMINLLINLDSLCEAV